MLTLTDVFEKFKASVQEITASEMEIAREIESEVAPEEVLNHYNYEETSGTKIGKGTIKNEIHKLIIWLG